MNHNEISIFSSQYICFAQKPVNHFSIVVSVRSVCPKDISEYNLTRTDARLIALTRHSRELQADRPITDELGTANHR